MRYDSTIEERHCISEAMILIILNLNSNFFLLNVKVLIRHFNDVLQKIKRFLCIKNIGD